jgi:hypothetical protein
MTASSIDRAAFENFYAGPAPWDVARPQPAMAASADRVCITATRTKQVGSPIRSLALPFVGLASGALPVAGYMALLAFVHRAVSGRWDRVPVFAAVWIAAFAAIGLAVGTWLALSRVRPGQLRTALPAERIVSTLSQAAAPVPPLIVLPTLLRQPRSISSSERPRPPARRWR